MYFGFRVSVRVSIGARVSLGGSFSHLGLVFPKMKLGLFSFVKLILPACKLIYSSILIWCYSLFSFSFIIYFVIFYYSVILTTYLIPIKSYMYLVRRCNNVIHLSTSFSVILKQQRDHIYTDLALCMLVCFCQEVFLVVISYFNCSS